MKQILGNNGFAVTTRRSDELEECTRTLHDRGVEIICIAGGDGTVHLAVQEIIRAYREQPLPLILPLPSRTMNNIARPTGYTDTPLEILKQLAASYRTGEIRPGSELLTLRINNRHGFIFGIGFPVKLLAEYYRGRGRGRMKAASVFLRTCWATLLQDQLYREAFAWLRWEVLIDGTRMPLPKYNALLCASVKDLGCGLKPTYRAFEKRGHFHAVVSAIEPLLIPAVLPRILLGIGTRNMGIHERLATHVVIRAEHPLPYFIDGEIYRDHRELSVGAGELVRLPSFPSRPIQSPGPLLDLAAC